MTDFLNSQRVSRLCTALAVAAATLVAMSAHAASEPGSDAATVMERGRVLVQRNCGMCHAFGGMDQSRNPQAPPFRDLHQRYDVGDLGEALSEGILTGHPAMPEFRFNPAEVTAIIRYLR